MASTVKSRLNHYQALGLTPTASKDEIARAYAREIGMFGSRTLTDVAQASIAFETLRDPERRRAYDESIGLGPKPQQPRIASTAGRAQFIGFTPGSRLERAFHPILPPAATPQSQPRPQPSGASASSEPRTASFIAASLRPSADIAPQADIPADREERAAGPRPLPPEATLPLGAFGSGDPLPRELRQPRQLSLADVDDGPVQWSRTVAVGGGLVACVVLLGALLGLEAGNGEEQANVGVTTALPAPKSRPATGTKVLAPARPVADAQPRHPAAAAAVAPRTRVATEAPRLALSDLELPEATPQPTAPEQASTDTFAEAPAVESAAALPLSNATIARTIERIGYSCGKVASTSAIDGTAGAFKVTCTSGQSYRAAPVRGRYHFRRLGGR